MHEPRELQVRELSYLWKSIPTYVFCLPCFLASWLITFLGGHTEWREKAAAEVEALLSANPMSTKSESPSLAAHLATISLETWESETPILDSIIRETLRVAQPHTAMRRNLGPEVYIDGKVVPTGAYVIYPFSDVHLDPNLYNNPWKFDPSREESKASFGYVGWGGGALPSEIHDPFPL